MLGQGLVELIDVAGARVEFLRPEQCHQTAISARDHERRRCTHGEHVGGSVIAVISAELDVELISTAPPVGALREQPVGDVAQRAMRPAESGPDPVARFAKQGAIGVVNTDEFVDCVRHRSRVTCGSEVNGQVVGSVLDCVS
jgi:hypothetical protein